MIVKKNSKIIKSLSVIIPFYNEKKRIKKTLKQIIKYKKIIKTEFILVNDGSNDKSELIVKDYLKNEKNIKLINLKKNNGKGYALKKGIEKSKNEWVLTTDVDFSVPLNQIFIWIKKNYLKKNCKVYFGSRSHKKSKVMAKLHRIFIGIIFKFIIYIILGIKVKDTQCGYKLYKKNIAKVIFKKLQTKRFEHDLEIVLHCKKSNYNIIELPVKWTHKSNSKVNLFTDPLKMFFGILYLKYKKCFI
jgi:dolichyl-phosphate beta-glucosyltransferase